MSPPTSQSSSSLGGFFKTIANKIFSSKDDHDQDPTIMGDVWSGLEASKAYQNKELLSVSKPGPTKHLRLAFRNLSSVPLMLCWVSDQGLLKHFYRVDPSQCLETDPINKTDKFENSVNGHAFCWIYVEDGNEEEFDKVQKSKDLSASSYARIVGGYRGGTGIGDTSRRDTNSKHLHLITIARKERKEFVCCTSPKKQNRPVLRTRNDFDSDENDDDCGWIVKARIAKVDPTPVPVKGKDEYVKTTMGGWPVYCEPNWYGGDKELEKRLTKDLQAASRAFPPFARKHLQKNCPIWINRRIEFGPAACPVTAHAPCCYHPDESWLIENGLCPDKAQCVEVNNGRAYKKDVDLWGIGGVMIHELSHAFHHSYMSFGYDNPTIKECYEAAMKDGLYQKVMVKGTQGPEAKAYACENCMEYFAELSAAFLGGADSSTDYNKWYPFNRKQIQEYDPRAYEMLCRVWKIDG